MPKPPPVHQEPPVVLTITLHSDGTATLLAQRGDLASLRAFRYRTLDEVHACIMDAAAHLTDIIRNPPPLEFQAVEAAESPAPEAEPDDSATDDTPSTSAPPAVSAPDPSQQVLF